MATCLAAGGRSGSLEFPLDAMSPVSDFNYNKLQRPNFTPFTSRMADFTNPILPSTSEQSINQGQFH
jgi:hypothetical protein